MSSKAKFSVYSTSDRTPMHFSGANGFPIGCYDALLNGLSQKYSITSVWHKGLWPNIGSPVKSLSWDDYADDLIKHLKANHKQPVIGVGHSMGATITLLAAAKAPKLFSQLVLIEPVVLGKFQTVMARFAPTSLVNGMEPIKSALAKTTEWKDKNQALGYFKKQQAYKRISDDQLKVMLDAMTDTEGSKQKLIYPLEWEVANYLSGQGVLSEFQKLKVPTAIIRGKPSIFVHDKTWQKMMRLKPKALYINEMDYGHLMPFESPQITRQLIQMALKKLSSQD